MIYYLPTTSLEAAYALSEACYRVQPHSPRATTKYAFGVLERAGQAYVAFTDSTLPVAFDAPEDALDAVLGPVATPAEIQAVRDAIVAARGQRINFWGHVPDSFRAAAVTELPPQEEHE